MIKGKQCKCGNAMYLDETPVGTRFRNCEPRANNIQYERGPGAEFRSGVMPLVNGPIFVMQLPEKGSKGTTKAWECSSKLVNCSGNGCTKFHRRSTFKPLKEI